jgi:ABC-type transport system involved in cytochrome c biogenesis permease component
LFAVLAFPLLFPGLTGAISGTQACLASASAGPSNALYLLAAFDGLLLTVAFMVFDFAWEE